MDSIDETGDAEVLLLCVNVDIITPQVHLFANVLILRMFVQIVAFHQKIMTSSKFFSFRFFTYRAEKAHFYMIDFCYLVNLSVILQTLFCGCEGEFCGSWFQTNYILTQGPIATAIILWANSLVFHSIDKVNIKKVISTKLKNTIKELISYDCLIFNSGD